MQTASCPSEAQTSNCLHLRLLLVATQTAPERGPSASPPRPPLSSSPPSSRPPPFPRGPLCTTLSSRPLGPLSTRLLSSARLPLHFRPVLPQDPLLSALSSRLGHSPPVPTDTARGQTGAAAPLTSSSLQTRSWTVSPRDRQPALPASENKPRPPSPYFSAPYAITAATT